jgi:hypothetical protein
MIAWSRVRNVVGGVVLFGGLGMLVASCAAIGKGMNAANQATGMGPKCPDVSKIESVLAFDFAAGFKIDAQAGAKLKAGTVAALELKGFAEQVDADLKLACGGLAKDLGAPGDFKDGKGACEAAIKAVGDVKGKLGAKATVALIVKEPRCSASLNAYADCAGKCDVKVSGGKAKVECEPGKLSGKCDASCEGSCDVSAAAKCDGQCSGSCDAEVKGSCSGTCDGKCDGKASKGACAGSCEGKCTGGTIKGECKGKCGGSCQLKAAAKCEGTCSGKCSTEFKEPKCSGEVKAPEMSGECKAQCDADVSAKMECTPAQVGVTIVSAADAKAADQLKVALEKNMPLVLKVAIGMGERAGKMAGNVKASVEGVQGSIQAIAQTSGNAAQAGMLAGQITACVGDTFKGALDAAGSLQANVKVSVDVKASASASGSAGGAASTK